MTVAEIAALLKLNQQRIDAGTLPAVRIGRRVLRSDLHQLIDQSYRSTAQPTADSPPAGIWDGQTPPDPEPRSSTPPLTAIELSTLSPAREAGPQS